MIMAANSDSSRYCFLRPDSVLRTFLKQLVTMASGWVGIDEETLLYCYRSYSDVMSCFFLGETCLTWPTLRSKHIGVYKDDWILLVCHLTSHCGSGGHGASHDDGWIFWLRIPNLGLFLLHSLYLTCQHLFLEYVIMSFKI